MHSSTTPATPTPLPVVTESPEVVADVETRLTAFLNVARSYAAASPSRPHDVDERVAGAGIVANAVLHMLSGGTTGHEHCQRLTDLRCYLQTLTQAVTARANYESDAPGVMDL